MQVGAYEVEIEYPDLDDRKHFENTIDRLCNMLGGIKIGSGYASATNKSGNKVSCVNYARYRFFTVGSAEEFEKRARNMRDHWDGAG